MILHAINCNYPYIVVTSRDTDVLVLLASQFKRIDCLELWMKAGTSKDPKNILVHNVVTSFSPEVIKDHFLLCLLKVQKRMKMEFLPDTPAKRSGKNKKKIFFWV